MSPIDTDKLDIPHTGAPISKDHPCINCGYNLIGLQDDSQCPECSTSIQRSLRGDLLRYADPQYLARLIRAINLLHRLGFMVIACVVFFILGIILQTATGSMFVEQVINWLLVAFVILAFAVWTCAWAIISKEEPGSPASVSQTRLRTWNNLGSVGLVFSMVVILVVGSLVALLGWDVPTGPLTILPEAFIFMQMLSGVPMLRAIARRLPSTKLEKSVRRLFWWTLIAGVSVVRDEVMGDRRPGTLATGIPIATFIRILIGIVDFVLVFAPLIWIAGFFDVVFSLAKELPSQHTLAQANAEAIQTPSSPSPTED